MKSLSKSKPKPLGMPNVWQAVLCIKYLKQNQQRQHLVAATWALPATCSLSYNSLKALLQLCYKQDAITLKSLYLRTLLYSQTRDNTNGKYIAQFQLNYGNLLGYLMLYYNSYNMQRTQKILAVQQGELKLLNNLVVS